MVSIHRAGIGKIVLPTPSHRRPRTELPVNWTPVTKTLLERVRDGLKRLPTFEPHPAPGQREEELADYMRQIAEMTGTHTGYEHAGAWKMPRSTKQGRENALRAVEMGYSPRER